MTGHTDENAPNSEESYISQPSTGQEYYQNGWRRYSNHEHEQAEADYRKALELSPDHPDILYAMGINYQASGRNQEAVRSFQRVIQILENADPIPEMQNRTSMLIRMSIAHINRIETGEWSDEIPDDQGFTFTP